MTRHRFGRLGQPSGVVWSPLLREIFHRFRAPPYMLAVARLISGILQPDERWSTGTCAKRGRMCVLSIGVRLEVSKVYTYQMEVLEHQGSKWRDRLETTSEASSPC